MGRLDSSLMLRPFWTPLWTPELDYLVTAVIQLLAGNQCPSINVSIPVHRVTFPHLCTDSLIHAVTRLHILPSTLSLSPVP